MLDILLRGLGCLEKEVDTLASSFTFHKSVIKRPQIRTGEELNEQKQRGCFL
jgi:hypothetical protein